MSNNMCDNMTENGNALVCLESYKVHEKHTIVRRRPHFWAFTLIDFICFEFSFICSPSLLKHLSIISTITRWQQKHELICWVGQITRVSAFARLFSITLRFTYFLCSLSLSLSSDGWASWSRDTQRPRCAYRWYWFPNLLTFIQLNWLKTVNRWWLL